MQKRTLGDSDLEVSAIESAVSKITVQGDRYPENIERMSGR